MLDEAIRFVKKNMKNKTDLRIYAKEIRKSLDTKSISEKIVDLITVLIYNISVM